MKKQMCNEINATGALDSRYVGPLTLRKSNSISSLVLVC